MTTPTDAADVNVAPPPPPAPDAWAELPSRDRRGAGWLPWTVAVVAAVVAATSTYLWLRGDGRSDDRRALERTTSQFLTAFVNWDASDGLDEVLATVSEFGTRELLQQLDSDELPPELRAQLTEASARSTGEVIDLTAAAFDDEPGRAVAYALVQQTVTSAALDQPETTCGAAHLLLELVDGDWRVAELDVFDRTGGCR